MSTPPPAQPDSLAPAEKVKQFPAMPGVYLMKDAEGRVIYVGKAKNLRNRASHYFTQAACEDRRTMDRYFTDRAARHPDTPTFDFVALDSTHLPYAFPVAHAIFQPAPGLMSSHHVLRSKDDLEIVRNRYRNGCHYVDELVGRLLDNLDLKGDLENTIVVITGDLINQSSNAAQAAEYKRIAAKLDPAIRLFNVPGNHDIENEPTSETLAQYRRPLSALIRSLFRSAGSARTARRRHARRAGRTCA